MTQRLPRADHHGTRRESASSVESTIQDALLLAVIPITTLSALLLWDIGYPIYLSVASYCYDVSVGNLFPSNFNIWPSLIQSTLFVIVFSFAYIVDSWLIDKAREKPNLG